MPTRRACGSRVSPQGLCMPAGRAFEAGSDHADTPAEQFGLALARTAETAVPRRSYPAPVRRTVAPSHDAYAKCVARSSMPFFHVGNRTALASLAFFGDEDLAQGVFSREAVLFPAHSQKMTLKSDGNEGQVRGWP